MSKIFRIALFSIIVLALVACNLNNPSTTTVFSGDTTAVELTVQPLNGTSAFNTVGQVINYSYGVTNKGSTALAGPVTVTDDRTTVTCPNVNTVGNLNNNLDPNELIICTSTYSITQADLNAGSVTNNARAKVGGVDSKPANAVVRMTENKVLTLTKTANPTTYNQVNQTITFTYIIKNTGASVLGPAQFLVNDDRISTPVNCGGPAMTLAANDSVTCTAVYTISQNDMTVNQITSNATASGGGAGVLQPVGLSITNTNITSNPGSPSTSLVKGSTIQHTVVEGEWMIQIARCYGADFNAVRNANSQVNDPARIKPGMILSIPNIGSNGPIYDKPCIKFIIVQSGDTWITIAQKYNADVDVLKEANPGVALSAGINLRVPLNSAGGKQPSPTPGAIRINFPTGSTSATIAGGVNTPGTVRYVLTASQGQTLNVKITIPTNDVNMSVSASNGTVLKPSDGTLTWSGTLPANGDYFIDIISVIGTSNKTFTLEVSIPASTSAFERVADINTGAGNSNPAYLTVFNGTMYFRAEGNDNAGAELWKYDSNLKAVSRVADINPGAGGSDPTFLTVYNSALYFKANGNDGGGAELWRFNGSATGRLTDINSGAGDSNPSYLAVYNNALYFSAKGSDGAGTELWKTDGTTAVRAADINAGPGDSNPSYLTVFNNVLYFSAVSTDGAGVELWKYDGTTATRVSDINPGVGNSNPAYLTVFQGLFLYFSANGNDGAGVELWKYDGVTSTRVADINPGAGDSVPAYLTVFNSELYFSANGNDGTGFELWKFDGTSAKRVSDIYKNGDSNPAFLAVFNNELFFQANGGDGAGIELWKMKGP